MTTHDVTRRIFQSSVAALIGGFLLSPSAAQAQQSTKLLLDWVWDSSHAVFAAAVKNDAFKKEGLTVGIDRGYGSGDTVAKIASGTYEFGYVSLNTVIPFNAKNPDNKVVCILVIYDGILNTVMGRKSKGITKLKDIEGRKIASPANHDGLVLFKAFAPKAGIDQSKVEWMTVQPNLRDSMLAQGRSDGMLALSTASFALEEFGVPADDIVMFKYADVLPDLVGRGIIVSEKMIREKPELIKAFVRAVVAGTKQAIGDPNGAAEALAQFDPLINKGLEVRRFQQNVDIALLTPNVRKHGLSHLTPERLNANYRIVAEAFEVPAGTNPADLYTDKFLPARSELMVPGK